MKAELIDILVCPQCGGHLQQKGEKNLVCLGCASVFPLLEGIPLFTDVPLTIEPWEKVERGPDKGTAWRRSNWRYLDKQVKVLAPDARILDVGAGHGDFADIFTGCKYTSLDIVPYPEVDLVCDLIQTIPFKPETFDAVVLMNVLEHVYDNHGLIKSIATVLKPGGKLILTVPFLLKVHQAPFDFSRYTPYFLQNLAAGSGLRIAELDGYYDTIYLLNESLGNVWQYSIDNQSKFQQLFAKTYIFVIQRLINALGKVVQKGAIRAALAERNPAPVGYLVVMEKA